MFRRSPIIIRLITFLLCAGLVISLCITPLATFITDVTDPTVLVQALLSSGLFGTTSESPEDPLEIPLETPTEAPTEAPTEESTEKPTEAPAAGEEPDENVNAESAEAPTTDPVDPVAPIDVEPVEESTEQPTEVPTEAPTEESTEAPTEESTEVPTEAPTEESAQLPVEPPVSTMDGIQGVLGALSGLVSPDMLDTDLLLGELELPTDTEVDTQKLGQELLTSGAAEALVGAYMTDVMNSAMGIEGEPTLSGDTVMELLNPHMGELTDIIANCLPEGTKIDRDALENATYNAIASVLPALVDDLPDISEAAGALLQSDIPELAAVTNSLKFIRTGGLRAAALLLVLVFCVLLFIFRLYKFRGLTCIGICGVIAGALCCGIAMLLRMPLFGDVIVMVGPIGGILQPFLASLSTAFSTCGAVYGIVGVLLIVGTTFLKGFLIGLFDSIFSFH